MKRTSLTAMLTISTTVCGRLRGRGVRRQSGQLLLRQTGDEQRPATTTTTHKHKTKPAY